MEIVEQRNQPAAVPLVVIVAVLATLLLGLAALALSRPSVSPVGAPPARAASTSLSPDSQDRNAQILATRLGKAEATHGH